MTKGEKRESRQSRANVEELLREYYRTRRDWRRFTCRLPDGRRVLLGDFGAGPLLARETQGDAIDETLEAGGLPRGDRTAVSYPADSIRPGSARSILSGRAITGGNLPRVANLAGRVPGAKGPDKGYPDQRNRAEVRGQRGPR